MVKLNKTQEQVAQFLIACKQYGFSWEVVNPSVVRVTKSFTPFDEAAFAECDMLAPMDRIPLKGGSVWGTDGASVGGYAALKSGKFVMNKSGTGSRFTSCLSKMRK